MTLLSVIAPTPRWMTLSWTSSGMSRLNSASSRASTEPETSPLSTRLSEVFSPSLSCSMSVSRVARPRELAKLAARRRACRCSAICRTVRSSAAARNVSPAPGSAVRPRTMTGRAGPASASWLPFSSSMARTRPCAPPATIESPARRVPFCTSTVATAPRPLSRCASMATPCAGPSIGAVSSSDASAVSRTASSSSSMPMPGLAATLTNMVSPPYSSATRPYSVSCWRTLSGLALRLVDLVDRDHDRHVGRLGVVQRLDRLRHHAVVGRDDQDHDVGHLGTTSTHGGERLVTRGVDEGDRPVLRPRAGRGPGTRRCAG